jgi:hypothetical protein
MRKKNQEFVRGQRVKIADNLVSSMSHFPSGLEAIVVGSYKDQYPEEWSSSSHKEYTLLILSEDPYTISWYNENQLTLIDGNVEAGYMLLGKYGNR